MEPDFYEDYKNLPLPELVKVARSPRDYLPEAVMAAERVLRERGVSTEVIAAEEWALAQKEMSDALEKRRFGDYFDWVSEIFVRDRPIGPVEKWFGLFLVFYSLFYVYHLFLNIQMIVWYARCENCREARPVILGDVVISIYSTVALFLMLKHKRLGWALLCIEAIAMNSARLLFYYRLYERHVYVQWESITLLLPFFAYTAILVFLFRPFILELFRVDREIRDRVLLIAAGVALLRVLFL